MSNNKHFLNRYINIASAVFTLAVFVASTLASTHAATQYPIIRVGTYNVLGSGAIAAPGFNQTHSTTNKERAKNAVQTIRDYGFDVVGLQEVNDKGSQFNNFKAMLKTAANGQSAYVGFPSKVKPTEFTSDRSWMRPIYWNKDRFKLVKSGILKYPWQNAPKSGSKFKANDGSPWVVLRDKATGYEFLVLNVHMVAYNTKDCRYKCNPPGTRGGSDKGGAEKRAYTAKLVRKFIDSKKKYPAVVTGDMNSAFMKRIQDTAVPRDHLPYCILTQNTLLRNSVDVGDGLDGQCPNKTESWPIDHIYLSSKLGVVGAQRGVHTDISRKTSDHAPRYVDVQDSRVATLKIPSSAADKAADLSSGEAQYQTDAIVVGD